MCGGRREAAAGHIGRGAGGAESNGRLPLAPDSPTQSETAAVPSTSMHTRTQLHSTQTRNALAQQMRRRAQGQRQATTKSAVRRTPIQFGRGQCGRLGLLAVKAADGQARPSSRHPMQKRRPDEDKRRPATASVRKVRTANGSQPTKPRPHVLGEVGLEINKTIPAMLAARTHALRASANEGGHWRELQLIITAGQPNAPCSSRCSFLRLCVEQLSAAGQADAQSGYE